MRSAENHQLGEGDGGGDGRTLGRLSPHGESPPPTFTGTLLEEKERDTDKRPSHAAIESEK